MRNVAIITNGTESLLRWQLRFLENITSTVLAGEGGILIVGWHSVTENRAK